MWFTIIVTILEGISALLAILHSITPMTALFPKMAERRKRQGNNLIAKMRQLEGVMVEKCGCTFGGIEDATSMNRTIDD